MPETGALLRHNLTAVADLHQQLIELAQPLERATAWVLQCLQSGGKLLCCGNGGSACDASHLVAEIVGRFVIERRGWPAVDLTSNNSLVTALINDYPAQSLFARQIEALASPGDIVVVFSTSGNSANVVEALRQAQRMALRSIAFLGRDGGACRELAGEALIVPGEVTARIQEAHLLLYHTLCEAIDPVLATP